MAEILHLFFLSSLSWNLFYWLKQWSTEVLKNLNYGKNHVYELKKKAAKNQQTSKEDLEFSFEFDDSWRDWNANLI